MTPRGCPVGTRTRTGTNPPDARTRVSRTAAMSGPGGASPRSIAMRPRASVGVSSCSGARPLAASSSSSAVVAWSSAIAVLPFAGNGEAFVPARGHCGTVVTVVTDAADVRQEDPGLARDVGAHVPGRGLRVQGVAGDLLDVVGPVGGRLPGRLDHLGAPPAQP